MNNLARPNKSQIKPAVDVLAKAFQDDPVCVYFFSNASERMNKLPQGHRMLLHHGVLYGEVDATSPI